MSFLKTLATLAVGIATARGYDKFHKAGGMANLQNMLSGAGTPGGLADTIGGVAEKMGIPGATQTMRGVFDTAGGAAASGVEAAQQGMGSLMSALTGAAASGSGMLGDMIASVTGATPMGAMAEEQAKLMIRAMIEAAKADGAIDADERAQITAHLKDASPEELAFVQDLIAAPLDLDALVAATTAATRTQVYSASLMTIKPDSAVEQAYLAQLATALSLDPAARDALHSAMGLPPLTA